MEALSHANHEIITYLVADYFDLLKLLAFIQPPYKILSDYQISTLNHANTL
jgi:hypothetical protein